MDTDFSLQDIVDELGLPRARSGNMRRLAIAGEFGSGKSSAINALLRRPLLPCNPSFTGRPLVKITHGETLRITGEDSVGRSYDVADASELTDIAKLTLCEIELPMPGMEDLEIIEVPCHIGHGIDPDDFEMLCDADLIVWMTIASQAWRLSEKAIVEGLPKASRDRSILAVSRADKLRTTEDVDKIEARMHREASPFFSEIVFMQATSHALREAETDADVWAKTGGRELLSILQEMGITNAPSKRVAAE